MKNIKIYWRDILLEAALLLIINRFFSGIVLLDKLSSYLDSIIRLFYYG